MSEKVNRLWYKRHLSPWLWWCIPLTWFFILVSGLRRLLFRLRLRKTYQADVPVIVIGNISVGGTGKTPLTMALVELLQANGFKPGIVSRGYRGEGPFPQQVNADSNPAQVGDEPYMMAVVTGVPVVVAPKRAEAVKILTEQNDVDVVLSDDGLQHYRLGRDIELAVVDAARGLGNGWRMPCGPLREGWRRLKRADHVLINGAKDTEHAAKVLPKLAKHKPPVAMQIAAQGWRRVTDGSEIETPDGESVVAVAGIGNPKRFFNLLSGEGLDIMETRVFDDHHHFSASDFFNVSNLYPVVMTEKDAVKCRSFARPHWYYLKVAAQLPESFNAALIQQIRGLNNDH
ncbi:tetraacyldisaccharide 4'-kinase [Aliidiomarina sedimenti]|uniref:Tetraacyldisaccharide 4'-kinase n=1 Tax=Aliidiomarina sedimenti TaxID=1933879 RepID=A0ABY0C103_9GAMM|nr:tetraacyldisaccharide 4'-kinase [Aliidiomarina sedimenti]RUO31466.1 tetraacyldisaccharide 4'-kinase [Aliidiomarina sedimenti]